MPSEIDIRYVLDGKKLHELPPGHYELVADVEADVTPTQVFFTFFVYHVQEVRNAR